MGGGASKTIPAGKKIVVVGGGYGGSTLGTHLKKMGASFTLVDAKDAFHHNMAAPRAIVEPGFAKKSLIPYAPTFGQNFKQGEVANLDLTNRKVILESGEEVPYDVLVLATGAGGPFPTKVLRGSREAAIKKYEDLISKIQKAQRIAVVGGGAAGVEMSAEIASIYNNKSITLLHASTDLVNNEFTQNFQQKLKEKLTNLKINLVLGEKVSNLSELPLLDGPATVKTEKGTTVDVDLVIACTGLKVNKEAFDKALSSVMEKNGALKVNDFLEVEGQQDVYAIGDCTNTKETKLAHMVEKQATLLADNLANKYSNQPLKAYIPGVGPPMKMLFALGPNSAMAQTHGGRIPPEFLPKNIKAKGMFVKQYWKLFDQQVPS